MISISSEFESAAGTCGWESCLSFDPPGVPGNSVEGTVSGEEIVFGLGLDLPLGNLCCRLSRSLDR